MNLFKTLPPLTKIRLLCALNILISVVSLILYAWIDPVFQNTYDTLILAFVVIVLLLIAFFIPRLILMVLGEHKGADKVSPGFLITKDGKVYESFSFFLKFHFLFLSMAFMFFISSGTVTSFVQFLEVINKDFIFLILMGYVAINIHNLIHLPWVYKNFPHLELPEVASK